MMEKDNLIALVLSALSSQTRVDVLKLLSRKGNASFTEIMQSLGLNIRTEAGKFAYHLRELTNAELVVGSSNEGYSLTSLGERVVDFIYLLEETALKSSKEMFVRTSRYSIDTFDRRKIAKSLINEAGVPEETAENVSKEVEERLLKMKVKYLTAPLIREFVNAILIEKGMEDYRHTLTRLGLPVYDVTELIGKQSNLSYNSPEVIHSRSGDAVLEQYTLLKALPRRVSDAHLSGLIHIPNANYWVLRPNSIQHDLRLVLSGLGRQTTMFSPYLQGKVKDAESAVSRILHCLQLFHSNVSGNQSLDHFNVILSPFVNKLPPEGLKRLAKRLMIGLRSISGFNIDICHSITTIFELHTPRSLKETPAVSSSGEVRGSYEEYEEAAKDLLSAVIDVLIEGDDGGLPYLSPNPIIKLCKECLSEDQILLKIHALSELWGTPFYINEAPEWQTESVNYDGNLIRLDSRWMSDWDLGTLRTGNLDCVYINLPRIAYESKTDDNLFFGGLNEALEICKTALDAKSQVIESRMFKDNVLSMLAHESESEPYYRNQNSTRAISYVGLIEASRYHTGASADERKETNKFSLKTVGWIKKYVDTLSRNTNKRWVVGQSPFEYYSTRLAGLDIERFGREEVVLDNKDEPYYSTDNASKKPESLSLDEMLSEEAEFHRLLSGGHMLTIALPDGKVPVEGILEVTKRIVNSFEVGMYAYARPLTHCLNCQTNSNSALQKCNSCGSSGAQLLNFDRLNGPMRTVNSILSSKKNRLSHQWILNIK